MRHYKRRSTIMIVLLITMSFIVSGCSNEGNEAVAKLGNISEKQLNDDENNANQSLSDDITLNEDIQTVTDANITEDIQFGTAVSEGDSMTSTQRNSINMLNYMTVLTQEINDSKGSRLYLESVYSSLINNIYPNAVDSRTQSQLTSTLDTLEGYRMITVKRERLQYIYEQNKAQAMRAAIPNPIGLLSAVQSGSPLKIAASVLYMAVDSASSYVSASTQADMQYLQDDWELDDEESAELHKSRKSAFTYMISMVRDNNLPGDYALNEESVKNFVEWKNNKNLERRLSWFTSHQDTYKEFGPYWLEMARNHYEAEDFEQCLHDFENYESITTRILRKDYDYAEAIPMAIISAKEMMDSDEYVKFADDYTSKLINNSSDENWSLRYYAAEVYLDLYSLTHDSKYLDNAYKIAFDNVNILVDEQKTLNAEYLADIKEAKPKKGATSREKREVSDFNNLLKEERKTALPPVSEALYLNCDLLFALADEIGISSKEQKRIDNILHENGDRIFLTYALDDRFWFNNTNEKIEDDNIYSDFDGEELTIPVAYVTDRSVISATVTGSSGKTKLDDWTIKKVDRPKNNNYPEYTAVFKSTKSSDYNYKAGDTVTITIVPIEEEPDKSINISFKVEETKKMVFKGIKFVRI